jgi:LuxR family transcriptional regulator, maltose regulon positive regulatory protein
MIDNTTAPRTPLAHRAAVTPPRRYGVPQMRPDHLVRRRLWDRLDQGTRGPLTLVSAPASTGKTSLVASWANAYRCPLLWITLDDADAEAATFWARLSTGLARIGVDVSSTRLLARSEPLETAFPSRLARCLVAYGQPVVLVVDAARTTSDPTRDRALAELLLRAGGTLKLILIARADPVFPMEWYRLSGELTEIRAGDLAASPAETLDLLRQAGMTVTPTEAEALCARTNGWIIALKLAIMSMSGASDVSLAIRRMSETDFDIVTYLFTEVIKALPLEIKDILLRTSVADLLTPDLVELLVGRPLGDGALEFLANGNQLIERLPVECHAVTATNRYFASFSALSSRSRSLRSILNSKSQRRNIPLQVGLRPKRLAWGRSPTSDRDHPRRRTSP